MVGEMSYQSPNDSFQESVPSRLFFRFPCGFFFGLWVIILIWVNYNDLTVLPEPWNHGLFQGNHPKITLIDITINYNTFTR